MYGRVNPQAALSPAATGGSREAADSWFELGRVPAIGRLVERRREAATLQGIRATMAAARQTRREAVQAEREAAAIVDLPTPLEALQADIARGTFPRVTEAAVVEHCRKPDPDKGDRHWITWQNEAPGYMVAVERLYREHRGSRALVEATMRHPANGGATLNRVSGAVNAPTIAASPRPRVSDSHDARPAGERGAARPYSKRQFGRDVTTGASPRKRCGECRTIIVSSRRAAERGSVAAIAAAEGAGRQWLPFEPAGKQRERRGGRPVAATQTRGERQRAAAGTIRMADID